MPFRTVIPRAPAGTETLPDGLRHHCQSRCNNSRPCRGPQLVHLSVFFKLHRNNLCPCGGQQQKQKKHAYSMLFCFPSRFSIPAVRLFNQPKLLELLKPLLGIARVQMNLHRDLPQAMRLLKQHGCCPPQGRELLRQKCEKYNADFRHSYNLFVLSSVFLRIHS